MVLLIPYFYDINLTSGMAKNQERVVKAFYESEKAAKEVENMCFLVL